MSESAEQDLLDNPPLVGADAATSFADDSEIILDHATVDHLSDEELTSYMEDPVGFTVKYTAEHGGEGVKVETANDGDTGPPPERPDKIQIPAKTDTAASDATTETATAAATATEAAEAVVEDVVIDNPFRDQGIPDIWMTDPKTGEPYENGMILGKYRNPDAAFSGVVEQQKLIGRKGLTQPGAPEPEEFQPQGFIAPVTIDDDTRNRLAQYAIGKALDDYQDEFVRMGLDSGEYLTDLDALRTASEPLYLAVKKSLQQHYQTGAEFVTEYMETMQVRDQIQDKATEEGFNLFVDRFVVKTGAEPSDSDLGVLNDAYNGVLSGVLRYDQQVQQAQQANPNVNVYEDPRVKRFYNQWYRVVNGVQVLDPDKVAAGALVTNEHLLDEAIRYSAVSARDRALAADAAAAPVAPITAASKPTDGATGGTMGMPSWEEYSSPDYLEKLIVVYGDEPKAIQAFDRMGDEFDRRFKTRSVSDKANF